MSKKKVVKQRPNSTKEVPVVVYMWAMGLGLMGYLVVGEAIFELKPHPIHWLAGLIGGIVGIGVGWIWYRYRGDII